MCVSPDPLPVPVQLSSSKAVLEHFHGLSSSRVVKELMSGPSPACWQFLLCREMPQQAHCGGVWVLQGRK